MTESQKMIILHVAAFIFQFIFLLLGIHRHSVFLLIWCPLWMSFSAYRLAYWQRIAA